MKGAPVALETTLSSGSSHNMLNVVCSEDIHIPWYIEWGAPWAPPVKFPKTLGSVTVSEPLPKAGQRQPSVTQGNLASGPQGLESESRSQFGSKIVKFDMLDSLTIGDNAAVVQKLMATTAVITKCHRYFSP